MVKKGVCEEINDVQALSLTEVMELLGEKVGEWMQRRALEGRICMQLTENDQMVRGSERIKIFVETG